MLPRCTDTTTLTDDETAALAQAGPEQLALPEAEGPADFQCELQAGHPDQHATLTQDEDDEGLWWWVRWGPTGARELVGVDDDGHCPDMEPGEDYVCTLFGEHWGGHCWELEETLPADESGGQVTTRTHP